MPALTHRALLAVVAAIAVGAVAGMVLLWPTGRRPAPPAAMETTALVDATLTAVAEVAGGDPGGLVPGATAVDVTARIDATGEVVRFETTDDTGATYRAGQRVRLSRIDQPGLPPTYFISDFRRSAPLTVLVALFVTAVLALGRWQGVRALLGLALTFGVIVTFIVPAVLNGAEPLAVAVVGSLAIVIVTLYLAHGFAPKTTAAVVGTTLAWSSPACSPSRSSARRASPASRPRRRAWPISKLADSRCVVYCWQELSSAGSVCSTMSPRPKHRRSSRCGGPTRRLVWATSPGRRSWSAATTSPPP